MNRKSILVKALLGALLDTLTEDDVFATEETRHCDRNRNRCCEKDIWNIPERNEPLPEWGIGGEPADKRKIFGCGFEIDEPRAEDYDERWQFESDHDAFDRFVDAGEDCIARGMGKKSNAPITKCNAVRKRIEEGPVMGIDLIGESHWW